MSRAVAASNDLAGEERGGQLRQPQRAQDGHGDDGRRDADAHLGERERDVGLHHHEIARGHQPDAAGAHRAVDGGDRRVPRSVPSRSMARAIGACESIVARRTLLQVGAGAEHRAECA